MSATQREAYEENKLKMRKAMADPALVDEMEQVGGQRGITVLAPRERGSWAPATDREDKLWLCVLYG